jgi:NAD(P)H-hydrate epimerase
MTGVLPLYSADEMRALDSRAIEELGIPGAVLMERAGLAAAHELLARYPQARRVAVVCGAGNNGGDGFVVARHLQSAGLEVSTHLVGQAARLAIDARGNLEIARQLGIPLERNPPSSRLRAALRRSDVVVDALFGTGFTGAPRAAAAAAIEELNRASAPVVALDVPSGVDASDGTVAGACVTAQVTITFHGPKAGLVIAPGARHAGDVVVADIGIPPQLERPAAAGLASHDLLDLVPRRGAQSTKYRAGAVLVVGGAPGMAGAPVLAGRAALRAGAGIAWLAVPESVAASIGTGSSELMVRPLPGGLEMAERAGAVVVGPGLGRDAPAGDLARRLARRHRGAVVIDADGLFALGGDLEQLARRRVPAVLTPHAGELARLLETTADEVERVRLSSVRAAARRANAVVLLKGADTLIAAPGGERAVVSVSTAHGLATAGTGDVLSGVIGSLLARGLDPLTAAAAGAVAHARAGARAAEQLGPDGIIAGDVIDQLPGAFAGR